jgi:hypothetical protein
MRNERDDQRSFCHRSIDRLPFPLKPLQLVIDAQTRLPESFEEACLFPFLKAIMDGGTRSQFSQVSHSTGWKSRET